MMISLFVPVIACPAPLLTANKRLCVCHGIRITLRCLPSLCLFLPPLPSSHNRLPCLVSSFPFLSPPLLFFGILPVVYILQAGVGWCHSPQAAEHLPFFTQGGWGERLPPNSHQQSYHRQRGQSQGPRYCVSASRIQTTVLCYLYYCFNIESVVGFKYTLKILYFIFYLVYVLIPGLQLTFFVINWLIM